jgi:hypothetical protein
MDNFFQLFKVINLLISFIQDSKVYVSWVLGQSLLFSPLSLKAWHISFFKKVLFIESMKKKSQIPICTEEVNRINQIS